MFSIAIEICIPTLIIRSSSFFPQTFWSLRLLIVACDGHAASGGAISLRLWLYFPSD